MKLIFLLIFLFSTLNFASIKDDVKNKLTERYPKCDVEFMLFKLNPKTVKSIENSVHQKFFASKVYLWKIFEGDSLTQLAIVDNVYGKTMPITFLVLFDNSANIKSVEVVKYREDHGGAIAQMEWLNQFVGKNSESNLKIGNDIDGISGATISTNSISKGIKKLSILAKEILSNE